MHHSHSGTYVLNASSCEECPSGYYAPTAQVDACLECGAGDHTKAASKAKKAHANKEHMEELQAQILMNAEVRKKNRMDFLDEGVQARQRMEAGRLKLESIKADKLATLTGAGVPQKYTVDLANKKFT